MSDAQALKTPWRVESDNLSYVSDSNGDPVCDCYSNEIASAIVACVNACAGVAHLEPGIVAEMVEAMRLLEWASDNGGEELTAARTHVRAILEAPADDC